MSERWVAVGLIAVVTTLNYRSLLWSAIVENISTAAKAVALLAAALAAFALGEASQGSLSEISRVAPASWGGFGLAMVTVMWTYSGWSTVGDGYGERQPMTGSVEEIAALLAEYESAGLDHVLMTPVVKGAEAWDEMAEGLGAVMNILRNQRARAASRTDE